MEKIKKRTSAGIAIFIDLLGFGKKVVDAISFADIKNIVNSLSVVREAFDYDKTGISTTTEEKRYALSDSVITFIPLQSEAMKYTHSFDVLLNEICNLAYDQMICIENGIFIRGGVSLGWFYEDGHNFISDALTQAVSIENNIWAPVIGISDHTIQHFLDSKGRDFYSEDADPMNNGIFEKCTIKNKEYYFLNYLKIAIEAVSPKITPEFKALLRAGDESSQKMLNEAYLHAHSEALKLHKEKILDAIKDVTEEDVLSKYQWLIDYHNRFSESYVNIDPAVRIDNQEKSIR